MGGKQWAAVGQNSGSIEAGQQGYNLCIKWQSDGAPL